MEILYKILFLILFSAEMIALSDAGCSDPGSPFHLRQMSGNITSPQYPNFYKAMESCDWLIEPPDEKVDSIGIIKIIHVEMDNDGADLSDTCDNATDYVEIGVARACGKLDPICVVFLTTTSRMECHQKYQRQYPGCASIVHEAWPLDVRMRTQTGAMKPGFKMSYEFVDCIDDMTTAKLDVEKPTTSTTALTTTSSALQRPTKITNVRAVVDHGESGTPKISSLLIVVIVLVGILFIIIVILIALRKKIKQRIKNFNTKRRIETPTPESEESTMPDKSVDSAGIQNTSGAKNSQNV